MDRTTQRLRVQCGLALGLGLLLRLFFILRYPHAAGDTLVYGDLAGNWLLHGVYGFTQTVGEHVAAPRPTLIRLPGYPLFLAACFRVFGVGQYGPVLFVQAAVDLVGCWVMAATARRLFGVAAFLPALWLACLCPFTAEYTSTALTETLTIFCISVTFYALVRWRDAGARLDGWLVVLGGALAYSILLRPEQGLLAAAVVPAVFVLGYRSGGGLRWRRALTVTAAVSCLTLLPLVPWTARNVRTMHQFQPLAPRTATDPGEANPYGFQRWYRTFAVDYASTATTYWPYDGEVLQVADLPARAFDSQAEFEETAALLADYNEVGSSTPALDARFNALAERRIKAGRLRYFLVLPAARVVNMTLRPRVELLPLPLEWWHFRVHPFAGLLAGLFALVNGGYLLLGWLGWRRRDSAVSSQLRAPVLYAMVGTIVLRCLLLLTVDNSEPRYTLEFFPVLIVFGGWRLAALQGLFNGRLWDVGAGIVPRLQRWVSFVALLRPSA